MSKPADRPQLVKDYLNDWPSVMSDIAKYESGSFVDFSCGNTKSVRSADGLISGINNNYVGYWSWESALIVKLLGIDDSLFKVHAFYPYDLVHFTPRIKEQGVEIGCVPENLNGESQDSKKGSKLVPEKRTDLMVALESGEAENFNQVGDRVYLYHSHLPKSGAVVDSDFDMICDSAVRYSVTLVANSDEVALMKNELAFVKKNDDWLVLDRPTKNVNELIDECGFSDQLPFMREVFLALNNGYSDSSFIYCSRYKEKHVDPLMILRYAKFVGDHMLCIECMVRDEALTYLDVSEHWLWLIGTYQDFKT